MVYYRVRGYPPPYVCGPSGPRQRERGKETCVQNCKKPTTPPTPAHPTSRRTRTAPYPAQSRSPLHDPCFHSPAQRISTTSPCTGSRPVTIFTINGPGFACARTHARNRKKAPVVSRRAARLMPTAKSQKPTPRRARKPNQTKPHMTHIHTTARTRGLLPAVLFPLSLSRSLSRGAACLRLSSPPPRLGLLLSSPNLSLARRINIALASPPSLASRASGRTDERAGSAASRRRGGCAPRCLFSPPPHPPLSPPSSRFPRFRSVLLRSSL